MQVFKPGEEGELAGPTSFGDLVGRLHPAVVHFPIAWLLLLLIVEIVGVRRPAWHGAGLWMLLATLLTCMGAILTGLLRASHLRAGSEAAQFVNLHRNLNLAMTLTLLLALAVRLLADRQAWGKWTYRALILTATALVLLAANLGGKMVYGANYLPF